MSLSSVSGELASALESLAAQAVGVAEPMAAAAMRSTSPGRERAVLRLLGVEGLDRDGRPLASEVVERYLGGDLGRLAGGVGLPFAVALLEYESTPQALALDVASGAVDLALEAELLANADRRAAAAAHFAGLVDAAMERFDANRTARRELLGVLGDRPAPWIGTTLRAGVLGPALDEAAFLVRAGIDLAAVPVPVGRELARHLVERGQDVARRSRPPESVDDPVPTGSQRGLARLRDALDQAAAGRGAYIRLGIIPAALATAEAAVVAGFERVDLIDLDPLSEIVVTGIDPSRALADFVFAARLAQRAGVTIHIGAGPLTVAPDLDAGVNSDPSTRSGRALALQLLTVAIARRAGIQPEHLLAGALPSWVGGESHAAARALAEIAVRRVLLPDSPLSFTEPSGDEGATWPSILGAVLPGDRVGLVLRHSAQRAGIPAMVGQERASAEVARQVDAALGPRVLGGVALDHATAAVESAARLLEQIAHGGWPAVLGSVTGGGWARLGADSVAPRSGSTSPDPVEAGLG